MNKIFFEIILCSKYLELSGKIEELLAKHSVYHQGWYINWFYGGIMKTMPYAALET